MVTGDGVCWGRFAPWFGIMLVHAAVPAPPVNPEMHLMLRKARTKTLNHIFSLKFLGNFLAFDLSLPNFTAARLSLTKKFELRDNRSIDETLIKVICRLQNIFYSSKLKNFEENSASMIRLSKQIGIVKKRSKRFENE